MATILPFSTVLVILNLRLRGSSGISALAKRLLAQLQLVLSCMLAEACQEEAMQFQIIKARASTMVRWIPQAHHTEVKSWEPPGLAGPSGPEPQKSPKGCPGASGPGTPFRTLFGLFWGPEGPGSPLCQAGGLLSQEITTTLP